jgi:sarcosine oxidase subunit alpha
MIYEAHGGNRVEAVTLAEFSGRSAGKPGERISCDLVVMSTGVMPAGNLAAHVGGALTYDGDTAMHRLVRAPDGITVCGSANGIFSHDLVEEDGHRAGALAAAIALGRPAGDTPPVADPRAREVTYPWPIVEHKGGKEFVDFDEDLSVKDIRNAVKDGYDDIQLLKRYSTMGMGSSQGRHSNVNAIRIAADQTGKTPDQIGTPTFRPPLVPEKFGHLAGRGFEPTRLTAMHGRHKQLGAEMMPAGLWLRPAFYGSRDGIAGEVRAVREGVGIIDVSTLGGLDIRGPDAAEFVDRMYTWAYAAQPVGRARYALMVDQTGVVIDDGVACRLHQNHFYLTATTGAVDQVYRQMTWWNAQWRLDVDVANVTAAYAGMNVAGPKSREALARLETNIDLSAEAFPYMNVRTGYLAGIPVACCASASSVSSAMKSTALPKWGEALWDASHGCGKPLGIRRSGSRRSASCAWKRATSSSARTRTASPSGRVRHGMGAGQEEAVLCRQAGGRHADRQGVGRKLVGFTAGRRDRSLPQGVLTSSLRVTRSPAASRRRCTRPVSARLLGSLMSRPPRPSPAVALRSALKAAG